MLIALPLFFATLMFVFPVGAHAATVSQADGLPELAAEVQALHTSVISHQSANTTLQATVATPQSANTTLQNALNAEIAACVSGDNTLQTVLTLETSQGSTADAGPEATLDNVQVSVTNTQIEVFSSPVVITA